MLKCSADSRYFKSTNAQCTRYCCCWCWCKFIRSDEVQNSTSYATMLHCAWFSLLFN